LFRRAAGFAPAPAQIRGRNIFMKRLIFAACVSIVAVVWACSSGPSGPAGGPVSGALDTHCSLPDGGTTATVVNPNSCTMTVDGGVADYGPTMYNAQGDDDDCKYHVSFTSTPIYENTDVTFTLVATKKADNLPASGLSPKGALPDVYTEIFLNSSHPAPNAPTTTSESPPGTFKIGPVRFDAPGQWTVRFHLFGNCEDAEDSPHGHGAFFINVP
jgi:hypothetical protein